MDIQINYWAVLLAAVSSMVVGSVWYAKSVFGGTWMKLAKMNDKKMKKGMVSSMVMAFVLSLLMAYVLAHLAFIANSFMQDSFFADSVVTAFWVWLGVAFTRTVTHDAFEQRPMKLTFLNITNMLVTMLVMGAVIGWLHP